MIRVDIKGLVGRNGPRGGGPTDNRTILNTSRVKGFSQSIFVSKGKSNMDGWIGAIGIFDLGFGQCGAAIKTPINRIYPTKYKTLFHDLGQYAKLVSLVAVIHG